MLATAAGNQSWASGLAAALRPAVSACQHTPGTCQAHREHTSRPCILVWAQLAVFMPLMQRVPATLSLPAVAATPRRAYVKKLWT